jgi:hypothetical protein
MRGNTELMLTIKETLEKQLIEFKVAFEGM